MTRFTIDDIRKIAAKVYDQDELSQADVAFLLATDAAKREYSETVNGAKRTFGPGEAFEAVKRLASRREMDRYAEALHALEAADEIEDEIELQQAAE